jgi:splicing factor U2AF subunit
MTPTVSQSILLPNLYQSPKWAAMAAEGGVNTVTDTEEKEHLEEFYLEMFEELAKFGDIEQIYLCENSCDHLIGNVYVRLFSISHSKFSIFFLFQVKFYDDIAASKAVQGLAGRFYAGRPIAPEFSPVTDFREGSCRQHDTKSCQRGGFCNFMHLAHVPKALQSECQKEFNVTGHEGNPRF